MTAETPAALLRRAAEKVRTLAEAATPGPWRQHDTHLGQYGHTATVLSGERNTTELRAWLPTMSQESWDETRNVWADAVYIAAMHPGVGLAMAKVFDQWARVGEWDPDLLNRIGGQETLALARQILGEDVSL